MRVSEYGYVYGKIPAKGTEKTAKIGLIAHMDTSDGVIGPTHPQVIENYDGNPITLKNGIVIDEFDFLPSLKGHDLIVTDGESVLGADDKAGIAEIMTLAEKLCAPDAPDHCTVLIGFTPDEEIGRGADHFDVEGFGADWAYTLDGGAIGGIDYENFNAASAIVSIHGVNIHPGSAKDQMKNAALIACEFANLLPANETPSHTSYREGFFHLCGMEGREELARLVYIIRDHDMGKFESKKQLISRTGEFINAKYGEGTATVEVRDGYRNMLEIIKKCPEIVEKARNAYKECDIEPVSVPIRGGTDGATLSYMGLPCPNLSTGGYNCHGRKELASVQQMEQMVQVVEKIVCNG